MQSLIAMLNDSWEVASLLDKSEVGFPRLTSGRKVLHDLFALAIGLGGIIMMWVSNLNFGNPDGQTDDERRKQSYLLCGLWTLLAMV